jgi:hypothetical protein
VWKNLLQRHRDKLARLDTLAATRWFRLGFGGLFIAFHLIMFSAAGTARLGMAFNTSPDEVPYFQDIHAPATRGFSGGRQPRHWSRLLVSRWDAQHYEGTALRGFQACPTSDDAPDYAYLDCGLGWLPAWGWVGHMMASTTGMGADYALLVSSAICALIVAWLLTGKTVVDKIGRFEAYAAVFAINVFPSGFYQVTPYSEFATLAFAYGGFVALMQERWFLAAGLTGTVTALRMPASSFSVAMGVALALATYRQRKAKVAGWWKPAAAIPLAGWGQALTMLVLKIYVGDWWAFFRARKAFGDIRHWDRLYDVENYLKGLGSQHVDMVIYIGCAAMVALTAREVLRRFNTVEQVYLGIASILTFAFAIVAPLHWWGMMRYLLMLPMAFLGAGFMAKKHPVVFVLWILLCLAFYWHLELCGYITQGDAKACPCMGHVEFYLPINS